MIRNVDGSISECESAKLFIFVRTKLCYGSKASQTKIISYLTHVLCVLSIAVNIRENRVGKYVKI